MEIYKAQQTNTFNWQNFAEKILENVSEGIAALDANHHILYCNAPFLVVTGKTKTQLQETSLINLFPDLDKPAIENNTPLTQTLICNQHLVDLTITPLLNINNQPGNRMLIIKTAKLIENTVNNLSFQAILEAIPNLAWVSRADGGVSYVNHRWTEYTGRQTQDLMEWRWQPFFHPQDLEKTLQRWTKAIQTGDTYENEFRFKRVSEEDYRWMLGRAVPIYDETGQITSWIGTCTDIHDQKMAEEDLEKRVMEHIDQLSTTNEELQSINEQLFKEIEIREKLSTELKQNKLFIDKVTDIVPCLVAAYNIYSGQYVYINKAIESIFGYTQKEVMENGVAFLASLIHPEDLPELMAKNAKALEEANTKTDSFSVDFEYRMRHRNGTWRWLHTSGIVFERDKDGKVSQVLNVSIDITERKEAESKILDSQHLIDQIVCATPDLLYIFDIAQHKNLYANREMQRILGYSQQEIQAMGEQFLVVTVHPDDYVRIPYNINRLTQLKDGEIFENEFRLKDASGRWRWVVSREVVFKRNSNGQVIQIFGSSQDITGRKEAQEKLVESQHLIQQIADATPDVLYVFDLLENKYIYVSREIYPKLGYTQQEFYALGDTVIQTITHPEDLSQRLAHFNAIRYLKDGEIQELEYRVQTVKGNWIWIRTRDSIFKRTSEGIPSQVMGISQDITERKMAEDEIRDKNKIINGILTKLPVILTRINKDGILTEAIGSGLRTMAYADNQIKGVNIFEAYPDFIAKQIRRVLQGEAITFVGTPQHSGRESYFLNHYFYDTEKECAVGFSIDITDQKKAEEKLIASEAKLIILNEILEKRVSERTRELALSQERYEIAAYVTHDAIWDWDLFTNQLTYSQGYYTIFGYSKEEVLGTIEDWHQRLHPEDITRVIESSQRVINSRKQVWSDEYRHQRKDGSYAYVFDRGYVQHNALGTPVRMVGAMTDITERKLAEETIRASEAKFRRMFESNMIGIFFWDTNGRITEANDKFLEIVGYKPHDVENNLINWTTITPEKYTSLDQQAIDDLKHTNTHTAYEKELIHKDGSLIPILIGGALLEENKTQGVAFVLDMTAQKKAQKSLALSEERFRLVSHATNDVVWDWDLIADKVWWNKNFQLRFGYKTEEIEIGPESWYSRIHPDEVEKILHSIHTVIDNGQEQWQDEYRFKRADGSYAYVLDRAYIMQNEHGKSIRIIGSMVDVTYLKETQEALEQQTAELKQSNADLEQFAFISSHDLQEPLNTASSFAKLLAKKYTSKLDADALEFIDFIVNSTERMKILIRSLLDYSKINTAGKVFENTDFLEVLTLVKQNLQVSILESQAIITNDPLPVLQANRSQMIQLFQHVISNAIKFRSTRSLKIHITATEKETHYLFSVHDNGIGMEMKYADKIFQVFQRLHSRDEYEGAGIGLATCKRIVDRHYGNIYVESEIGKGATFYFTIKKLSL